MEQPTLPNANPSSKEKNKVAKKKGPTPQELISHYQSKGLDSQEASVKVIEDLQNLLFRVVSANNKNKKDKLTAETLRKVDVVQNRVGILDMKIDSKPGYFETFAIGVASGAAFRGFETVWPHVLGGVSQIWTAVTTATKPPPSS
ncbi:uncharacterized protein LOC8259947 [Ricinus communis]|uniref:Uncharacterized protein n=1 Tax=Ricinus communis TaxID=3988 RepID=B9RHT7_RICCO|nr:uncharacterized protein LOC8259947 [Ricinus communis]EEF48709.1 conserved hypothetical protein [Ricinus communis]|eukprot:XP_015571289.1 uncharacterized protein LOC8259947 [Ricinus communis]